MRLGMLVSVFLFVVSLSHAGQMDSFGNEYPAMWRSSRTITPIGFAMMGTTTPAPMILHSVICMQGVDSSTIAFYNSSTGINNFTIQRATTNLVNCNNSNSGKQWFFDVPYSSGLVPNRIGGNADITVLWNYLNIPREVKPRPYPH